MSHSLSSTLACTLAMRSYEWQNIKYMSNTVLSFTLCIYTFNSRNVCVSWVGIMRHKIFVDTHQWCLKMISKNIICFNIFYGYLLYVVSLSIVSTVSTQIRTMDDQHFLGKKLHVSKKCVVASVASQQPGSELRKYTPALCLASYFIHTDVYV